MSDLISRKALLKELRRELKECRADGEEFGGESILWAEGIEFAIDAVKAAKGVDAEEVVRCKDCKRWLKDVAGCTDFVGRCAYANYMIGATGYCLYGERKEKGDGRT